MINPFHFLNLRVLFLLLAFLKAQICLAESENSVALKSGYMNFNISSLIQKNETNFANVSLEWMHYFEKDFASYAGYRIARDTNIGRTIYQAAFFGGRYFPLTLGVPINSYVHQTQVEYNFTYMPYIDVGATLGRYSIDVFAQGAYELSSEFFGLSVGVGSQFHVLPSINLDIGLTLEQSLGYSQIVFSAVSVSALVGVVFYF